MNRVPFDKLLRGVQDSRDPSSQLGMFGSGGEKLKRIEKLETNFSGMAQDYHLLNGQVQEMGNYVMEDGLAIKELKVSMNGKASSQDLKQVKTEVMANCAGIQHDLTKYMNRIQQEVMPYPGMMKEMASKQTVMFHAISHQMDLIAKLQDSVRELRDNKSNPDKFKESIPETRIVKYKPPIKRWPTRHDAPLYNGYPGRDPDEE
jgi:hypothetical protein